MSIVRTIVSGQSRQAGSGSGSGFGSPLTPYPQLKKLPSNPVITIANSQSSSILWPYLVDLRQSGERGVALFWSTDHASGHSSSGVFMATAPSPKGPWTVHGRVFRDDITGGTQCETPSVIWDDQNEEWLMYYQLAGVTGQSGTGQRTLLATAPRVLVDGTPSTWTVQGLALDVTALDPGDGHTGYFKPFRYAGQWYGHSLCGGTQRSRFGLWVSKNGREWTLTPGRIGFQGPLLTEIAGYEAGYRLRPNSGVVLDQGGQLWALAPCSAAQSGGDTQPNTLLAVPIAGDAATFARPVDVTPDLQPWEDAELGVTQLGGVVNWNGTLYTAYRSGGGDGGIGIAEVE